MKNTGAKIAKFGTKIAQSYLTIGAKIVGAIPGLKLVGKAMDGVAKVAGVISAHIPANLGSKLQKGMNAMGKIVKYANIVPMRRDLSEEVSQFNDRPLRSLF